MTPEEHAAQSLRMEQKMDDLLTQVTRIETYQKTHYGKLGEHDEDIKALGVRIGKNEQNLARASGVFTVAIMVVSAWLSDFFKRGGS